MDSNIKELLCVFGIAATGLVLVAGVISIPFLYLGWKQAGIQAAVYDRQGVHMTQWELFMGAEPIERSYRVAP